MASNYASSSRTTLPPTTVQQRHSSSSSGGSMSGITPAAAAQQPALAKEEGSLSHEADVKQRSSSDAPSHDDEIDSRKGGDEESATPRSSVEEALWREHQAKQQPGVTKIEEMYRSFGNNKVAVWTLYFAVAAVVMCFCLDGSTTSSYETIGASAFGNHGTLLGIIGTAEGIIIAVSKPFIAKICDISSRQTAYLIVLISYVVGYAIIAGSQTVAQFAVGRIISATGQAGLDLVTDIIVADLSPLEWRGFITAATSSPYLFLAWVGPNISGALLDKKTPNDAGQWRWGFGMFCIIAPVSVLPAIIVLYYAQIRAKKQGKLAFGASPYERRAAAAEEAPRETKWQLLKRYAIEMDFLGLILLSFAFALIFLPFSLQAKAKGKWANPSMIGMMVSGGVILIMFFLYEWKVASKPVMNGRIMRNRTFQMAVTIDIFYFMSGNLRSLYYSSYVYVVKDWSNTNWGYFNNITTFCLTLFGMSAGLILRGTHRYKILQISGLAIRLIGMGITFWARGPNANTTALIWTQILISLGGACSVVGTRVASQASVPHQDLAMVIALLSLWTKLGGSVGSAIASAIWNSNMEDNIRNEGVAPALAKTLTGNIKKTHDNYALDSPIRQAVIRAYDKTTYPMFLTALLLSVIPLICGFFMPNYYLGKRHNAIEALTPAGRVAAGENPDDATQAPGQAPAASAAEPQQRGVVGWLKRNFW